MMAYSSSDEPLSLRGVVIGSKVWVAYMAKPGVKTTNDRPSGPGQAD
jgi:hypothetical protein